MHDWLQGSRPRFGVGFAEGFLLACRSGPGLRGGDGAAAADVERLPSHLLSASAVEPNVRAVSKLARIAGEALESLGGVGRPLAVALPDLALRVFVFPPGKAPARAELASRITAKLPYAREEARVDAWTSPAGWTVAAAVRVAVLRQYEQALEALGCRVVWADGASLIPLPLWAEQAQAQPPGALGVHVQLFSRHYTLSVLRGSELIDVRAKLRAAADEERIAEQVIRVPRWLDDGALAYLTVHGRGASALAEALEARGMTRECIHRGGEGEENHMKRLVEMLLSRG